MEACTLRADKLFELRNLRPYPCTRVLVSLPGATKTIFNLLLHPDWNKWFRDINAGLGWNFMKDQSLAGVCYPSWDTQGGKEQIQVQGFGMGAVWVRRRLGKWSEIDTLPADQPPPFGFSFATDKYHCHVCTAQFFKKLRLVGHGYFLQVPLVSSVPLYVETKYLIPYTPFRLG